MSALCRSLSGWRVLLGALAVLSGLGSACAETITVPGYSFESPATSYVSINIDSWQKTAKPASYDESGGFLWTQLTGIFANPPPNATDHLDNCDGSQALWIFAVPQAGLFQDYDSRDWNDSVPTRAFNAKFEVGKAYTLTVGLNGGGGGMLEGSSLQLALYYRNPSGNIVTVAVTTVVHSFDAFPNHTHFFDYQVRVPAVQPGDAWANKQIGIRMLSLASDDDGGYWDVDNVRLAAEVPLPAVKVAIVGAEARVSWLAAPGYRYQLAAATDLSDFQPAGEPLTGAGAELAKLFPLAGFPSRFFRLTLLPP